ncbi:MAG TPA: hypothetical protein VFR78_15730 [Pyrinomonadaceae bacterium]|nr:hypothetical protein [Pyrinomonadaceae bacterium]
MPRTSYPDKIAQLDELKNQFAPDTAPRLERTLDQLSRKNLDDTDSLFRYHEILLFLRAYPQSASIVRLAEKELRRFPERIERLRELEVDLAPLQHPDVSGIAGTSVTDNFSFLIVRWLLQQHASELAIEWDWFENENALARVWPRLMPLLEEDAFVEANVPYREWLRAARRGRSEIAWLIEAIDALPRSDDDKTELYDSQQLYVRWTPRFAATRTGMRLKKSRVFYHREPLIPRRDVDLAKELAQPSPPLRKLSLTEGELVLDMAREASTIRYRELYGFTHGDPEHVYHAELGRGVEIFLFGLPAERRLPLRACHALTIYKNGVPIGYFEGLSLFERMETGFNLYYTFREGETAWLYARILNVLHHFTGVTAFSLDPYQIGHENEEGIASGAFWFYRKLGFRPTQKDALQLALKEEAKLATRKGYRTPAATLRKLAKSPMIFELDQQRKGDWDGFHVRNIGFKMQRDSVLSSLIPEEIAQGKKGAEEVGYLRLMQKNPRLREAILKLGRGFTRMNTD